MFVAIALSDAALAEIARIQGAVAQEANDVYRLLPTQNLHLTLYFLGEMDQTQLSMLIERLQGAKFEPIELALGHIVNLPAADVPKILAISVQSAGLGMFQQRVHDLCFPVADHKETRPYLAHVTVARLKSGVPASAKVVKRTVKSLPNPQPIRWPVHEITIYRSQLGKGNPQYEAVASIPIGG